MYFRIPRREQFRAHKQKFLRRIRRARRREGAVPFQKEPFGGDPRKLRRADFPRKRARRTCRRSGKG